MPARPPPAPFAMDEAQAWALLLPPDPERGFPEGVPPWKPWAKPSPGRDIDAQVRHLRDRKEEDPRNTLCLRTREELEGIDIACPYRHARAHIVQAVADAAEWTRAMAATGPDQARDLDGEADALRDAARALEVAMRQASRAAMRFLPARPASHRSASLERSRTRRLLRMEVDAESVAAYLREVAEDVTALRRHLRPGNNPGEVWQQAFAERLGYCWRDLTGNNPSAVSDEFIDFLHAAFASLGGGERALTWKGPVKTAVARVIGKKVKGQDGRVGGRPPWDQFDRLETGARPPGGTMNVRPLSELEARQERRQRRFVRHVLDWADASTEEARRAAHLVLLYEWYYAPEDQKNREEVRRIVANRDAGGNDVWAGSPRIHYSGLPR